MIPSLRSQFNSNFTEEKYEAFLRDLRNIFPGHLDFRVAETPLFIPKAFTQQMLSACDSIVPIVTSEDYRKQSENAIPSHLHVPHEDAQPQCIAFDFGICQNGEGHYEPQLIELQAFPTLFAWQVLMPELQQKHFPWPQDFDIYLNGYNRERYLGLLKDIIIGDAAPEHVVLLEILPHQQKQGWIFMLQSSSWASTSFA